MKNTAEMLELIGRWAERGWLRELDRAFATFLVERAADADPLLILAAGTALWRDPASHAWLAERWVVLQSRLGLAPAEVGAAPAASPYSDSPRKLSDCIKPGNVIDDEVRACVKGYRPRTW